MLRTFAEHAVRPMMSLDGRWEFVTEQDKPEMTANGIPANFVRTIQVPSAWESLPGLETYRGRAWYRTVIGGLEGYSLRLVFGGVSHTATVYIDGEKIGEHYDAFTPWDIVAPGLSEGEHELILEVDNSFGDHSALHIENDYYTYGGITRPVEAHYVPEVFLEKIFAKPFRKQDNWFLDVRIRLRNLAAKKRRRQLAVNCAGSEFFFDQVVVAANTSSEFRCTLDSLDVQPWSAEQPTLYFLEAELIQEDDVVDDLVDRVGFREVKTENESVLLNDEVLHLKGFNRHEDHPQFGNALPLEAIAADLELLRDLGANFIRTSHYPNDMRLLDLCDELGIYVWEESHARTVSFEHPKFKEQIAVSTTEMIEWHYNRPAIISWGCLNECASETPAGRKEYEQVFKLMRQLDDSRPLTFASCKLENDICLDLVDIVSFNIYVGWYGDSIKGVQSRLHDLIGWLDSGNSGGADKPLIISEFGAGAIYGNRQRNHSKWSEEYQADLLDESLKVYLEHPRVSGVAIWQFCDVRITPGWAWGARPRCMNNKGVVDEYRRPKLAYELVRDRFKWATTA